MLDAVGNRTQRLSTLPGLSTTTAAYNAEYQPYGQIFDKNGNTISAEGKTYASDFRNRIKSVNNGQITLGYDGNTNRTSKTVGGVTTNYLVDELSPSGYAQVVEELVAGQVQRVYTHGLGLVSQRQKVGANWTTHHYGTDGSMNVRFLTDSNGTVTDTWDYDAFGNILARTGTTANSYLYRSQQYDADLGFYYLRARYYNPRDGRFITQDEFSGMPDEPRTLHKYLYANGDGVNLYDPSGYNSSEIAVLASRLQVAAGVGYRVTATAAQLTHYGIGLHHLANRDICAISLLAEVIPTAVEIKLILAATILATCQAIYQSSSTPVPLPTPVPSPTPSPTPPIGRVNLDTSTAIAFSQVGFVGLPALKAAIGQRGMLMCQTAYQEFLRSISDFAGPIEKAQAASFLTTIQIIPDMPDPQMSNLPDPNGSRINDKIIFGTGQSLNIQTFTGDGKFVKHATSNGFKFQPTIPHVHPFARFTGQ